jgi:hypothetical protein
MKIRIQQATGILWAKGNGMTANSDDQLAVPTEADRDRLDAFWKASADVPSIVNVSPKNRVWPARPPHHRPKPARLWARL